MQAQRRRPAPPRLDRVRAAAQAGKQSRSTPLSTEEEQKNYKKTAESGRTKKKKKRNKESFFHLSLSLGHRAR